ncbi:MAG: phosphoribosylformylglycinamidine cyclo-ligase [Spirochaetes bacterium]|nr:MAG: phosphoribosylformylglycinamidine cyclo-ligase [Spirochaetota bacterium]
MKKACLTYRDSGVDIERGESFVDFIRSIPSSAVSPELGGFAGGIEINTTRYRQPVLFTTTDGVGTKLLLAKLLGKYDTIGIDLVAMCTNDLMAHNVTPLLFLDYISYTRLDENFLQDIMRGIVRGCEMGGCILAGGETAEMPDLYRKKDFDLAGFCAGIGEKADLLPKKERIKAGDVLLGLPSSGVHSNGLSLARKVFGKDEEDQLKKLLEPTRIYTKELKELFGIGGVLAAAHITGGGLFSNIKRVIPLNLLPKLNYGWNIPEIFSLIQSRGSVSREEMFRVFNMGVGMVIVVERENAEEFLKTGRMKGIEIFRIGELING